MKDEVIFVDKICKCSVASEAVMEADAVPLEVAPTSEMAPVLLAEIQSRNRERWELTDETPLGQPKVLNSERKCERSELFWVHAFLSTCFFVGRLFESTLLLVYAIWAHAFLSARLF